MSLKTIEKDKMLLLEMKDFNLNDAFKILAYNQHKQPNPINGNKELTMQIGNIELNQSLLGLPGKMFNGDPMGCSLFCKKFAKTKKNIL